MLLRRFLIFNAFTTLPPYFFSVSCSNCYNWIVFQKRPFKTNYDLVMVMICYFINPFSTNVPLLYSLKTSESRKFSDVFREHRNETLVEHGLTQCLSPREKFPNPWVFLVRIAANTHQKNSGFGNLLGIV